jgi:hypothetical protein
LRDHGSAPGAGCVQGGDFLVGGLLHSATSRRPVGCRPRRFRPLPRRTSWVRTTSPAIGRAVPIWASGRRRGSFGWSARCLLEGDSSRRTPDGQEGAFAVGYNEALVDASVRMFSMGRVSPPRSGLRQPADEG